jgi:glycosyltransferase involved in cell wall biosynthesis
MQPPARKFRSGGYVYNAQLAAAAARRGIALVLRDVSTNEIVECMRDDTTCVRIWDSLFMETLASGNSARSSERGLLLHYLPSQDPTLDHETRMRFEQIEARALRTVSLVITTGRAHQALIESAHPTTPAFFCEPGVSQAFLAPPRATTRREHGVLQLLTVANFTPAKGLVELLFALSHVLHIDWRWHVIGDETRDAVYTSHFDAAVRQLDLAERVVRHGTLDEHAIARLMDQSDLFVYASRFEAYGMALAEAAARRLPAVTTDVGAASSLYSHGNSGLVSAVNDSTTFAEHLERLMSDAVLRERFRERLATASPRTWDDTLDDFSEAVSALA